MLKSNVSFHNAKLVSIPDKNKPVSPLVDISGGNNKEGGRKEDEVYGTSDTAGINPRGRGGAAGQPLAMG